MSSRQLDRPNNRSKTPTSGTRRSSSNRNRRSFQESPRRSKTPTSGKRSPRRNSQRSPRRGSKSPRRSQRTSVGVSGGNVKRRVEHNRLQREKEREQREKERLKRRQSTKERDDSTDDDDDDDDNDDDEEKDVVSPLPEKKSGFFSKFGFGKKDDDQVRTMELAKPSKYSKNMKEVQGVGVFVNGQMILRAFCDDVFENAFKAATDMDFKSACLKHLDSRKEKEIFNLDDPYTMWNSEISDKEVVFLMVGEHDPYPVIETLHQTIISLFNSLKSDNTSTSTRHKRSQSSWQRSQTLQGLSSIQEVFQMMDLDGGGTIDEAEFSTGLFSLGVDWDSKQISKLFNEIDTKNEGEIAFSDFMKFMMKPNNKKEWKELKRAIQKSIVLPTAKDLNNEGVDVVKYQKKLSSCEKLIDMMEEQVYETCDKKDVKLWSNKISQHREFIRRHQDVVGKAMGLENVKLKKRLSQLEDQTKRIRELELLASGNKNSPRGTPKSRRGSYNISGDDNEALIKRLRRENQELKRKVNNQDKEIKQMEIQQNRRPSSVRLSQMRRTSQQNLDNATDMLAKLRAENRELRKERDELRSEKSQLQTQLQSANDKIKIMSKNTGVDETILNQLSRFKQETNQLRSQRNMLRDEAIKLKGVDNSLRKKLSQLAKKLANIDQRYASNLRGKESLNDMLEELVDQLDDMTDRYNAAQDEIAKLRQELRDQARRNREEVQRLKNEIKRLKSLVRDKEDNIVVISNESKDKDKMINDLQVKLRETERLYNDAKNVRRELGDKQDEIDDLKATITKLRKELGKEMNDKKKYKQQLQLISKMPGNASLMRQIGRLHQIFDRLDTNKDGKLSFEEFEKGAEELGFGDNIFEQQEAFDKMDKDNDGFVIYDDFEEACLKLLYDQQDNDDNNWRELHNLLSKPPNKWNVDDVSKWLEHIGMGQYADNFRNGNVDGKRLLQLKPRDLKDLGVVKSGHQRKIMNNLKDLLKRDDLLSNLKYENEELKSELDYMKENGPTWIAVRHLQSRIRDLEGDLRKEKHERENILNAVKDELENSKKFEEMKDNDKKDLLSEIALLKGALANERLLVSKGGRYDPDDPNGYSSMRKHLGYNDKDDPNGFSSMRKHLGYNDKNDPDNPNGYSSMRKHLGYNDKDDPDNPNGYSSMRKHLGYNDKDDPDNPNGYANVRKHYGFNKKSDIVDHDNKKIIGRFLQKWYVLANHQTQYWISRTNEELDYFKDQFEKINGLELSKTKDNNGKEEKDDDDDNNNDDENKNNNEDEDGTKEPTEIMDWIVYDTRRERIIHEVRMKGRGMNNDPKDVKIEISVSPSGPWTTVAKTSLQKSDKTQRITGFAAKGRFWRVCMLNNHGENHPQAPRYVMYEVQFWGPLDEDVQNNNFVIE